jgi:hypothetical protein
MLGTGRRVTLTRGYYLRIATNISCMYTVAAIDVFRNTSNRFLYKSSLNTVPVLGDTYRYRLVLS